MGILGGDLGGDLNSRSDRSRCRLGKGNHRRKNICLCKDRLSTGIHLRVFITVSHAASKLISKSDFSEHFCYRWILCEWPECFQIQVSVPVCKIRIFCCDFVLLNDEFRYISAGKITVHKQVGDNLTQDFVSCAYPLDTIQCKNIIQMLLSKFHQTIKAFNQICDYHISVIIAIHIEHPENSVCLMLRQHRHDTVICAEE